MIFKNSSFVYTNKLILYICMCVSFLKKDYRIKQIKHQKFQIHIQSLNAFIICNS